MFLSIYATEERHASDRKAEYPVYMQKNFPYMILAIVLDPQRKKGLDIYSGVYETIRFYPSMLDVVMEYLTTGDCKLTHAHEAA